jgi:hypothetical protein
VAEHKKHHDGPRDGHEIFLADRRAKQVAQEMYHRTFILLSIEFSKSNDSRPGSSIEEFESAKLFPPGAVISPEHTH